MLTFTDMQNQFQDGAEDTTAASLTSGKRFMNIGLHILEAELGSYYMEETRGGATPYLTVANINSYNLPENFIRLQKFFVAAGGLQYVCEEVFDEELWRIIQSDTQGVRSNFCQKIFVRKDTFEIFPTPSSANPYTIIYESSGRDLSNDDYITGTITTLAANGTAVTGSGMTWTAAMAGRQFKINSDAQGYKIASVTNTTNLVLASPYQGAAIAAGTAAYTIGETSRLPQPTQFIPVTYALWQYYKLIKKDVKTAAAYQAEYEEYMKWAKSTYSRRFSTKVIRNQAETRRGLGILNPNNYPQNMT